MRIALASDHAGVELKKYLMGELGKLEFELLDLGTNNPALADDYPDFAEVIGKAIVSGEAERGILICGSGVGASVAANKMHSVRAGLCHDTYSAHQGVEHDNMNVLVLGSRVIGIELAHELALAYLNARFSGEERHVRRLKKIAALEAKNG